MTWSNRVVWLEGMFLRAQHFQQQDRWLEALVRDRTASLRPHGWGLTEGAINRNLLATGQFALASGSGVFEDGTPFSLPGETDQPVPLDLPETTRNALVYLVLISWVAHAFSYWTVQMESGESDPRAVRILNQVGRDLQSTGMARVARAVDPLPEVFYESADLAGLLYQNSLLEARLSRYPGFLTLAERPEFQTIGADKAFAELRLRRAPIREVLDNPNISAIANNPEQLKVIWNTVTPDLKDLTKFLKEGTSDKYTDKILGRWFFDVNAAMAAYRKTKPNLPSSEMLKFKRWLTVAFGKTVMIAAPDNSLVIKNLPQLKTLGGTETQNTQGSWKSAGSEYQLALGSAGERHGKLEAGRLVVSGEILTLVFAAED